MLINDCIILVVLAFFGLMVHAIHSDEKRKADRRRQCLPFPVERRIAERRSRSLTSHLAWAIRSQWSKLTR